jgi:hypothetical protein
MDVNKKKTFYGCELKKRQLIDESPPGDNTAVTQSCYRRTYGCIIPDLRNVIQELLIDVIQELI